ncbi:MAG TPA: flagellar motor protein MotA [Alphaproteobacteria bacterium]|nr:flagellar motor protein MotA [Alphaproteobacteria bacterium]
MTRPYRFLFRMVLFLLAVIAVCLALRAGLTDAFLANPPLNGMIIGVLLLGVGYNFRQVLVLNPEVTWIEHFRRDQPKLSRFKPPRLLAPMATMLGDRKGRVSLSAIATRSMLDSIGSRLDESRDISRYLIGLEIFLGLLGTFWGLLETVGAVSSVIGGLSTTTDTAALFNDLQAGLKAPLSGMGTAFGTSLFGLAGSLVLGFLDLQASQAQNRFYNDLEEWLSSLTRLSSGGPLAESEQAVPAYIQALLEQTADNLENLQRTMARAEEGRGASNTTLAGLADRLTQLTEQMRAEQSLLGRLAEAQMELKPVLTRLADAAGRAGPGGDEALRTHLRNMEVYLARIIEDGAAGRTQMTQDLRNEIRLLARTIAALAEEEQR